MTGPEHYKVAEDLMATALAKADEVTQTTIALTLATAQVHATLALAAATGVRTMDTYGPALPGPDRRAWRDVAGTTREANTGGTDG